MNLQSIVNHLEACLVQEINAKAQSTAWIESMETAIQDNDSNAFESIAQDGSKLCRAESQVAKNRSKLMAELAQLWNVRVETLTLGSVVRRLAGQGERLDTLRKDLRRAVATVIKRQRRLSALIGLHQRINADIMQVMLGCDSHEEVNQGGALVNAEA